MSDYYIHEKKHDDANEEMIEEIIDFIKKHRDEEHVVLKKDGKKVDVKNLVLVMMSNGEFVFNPIPFVKIENITYLDNHRMKINYVNGNMSWINLKSLFDIHVDIDEKPYQAEEDREIKHENNLTYQL